ncbi:S8 family peptidase [Nocardioides daeguensis]|uniref:S8 family peptidase n=1 Tax=Nocardioides daeguensis TaxID=908359 RepID=A0ABP6WEL4_9ACTN|nr:S8 family peptidase [Nocardioides daeguensis]MBV6729632.1 S8 family peptidase [Nocardioides daeguensis]MCR1775064.1 S8 family peptidase [Nocardioides daeguensis]
MPRILGFTASCALALAGLAAVPATPAQAQAQAAASGLVDVIVTLAPGADAAATARSAAGGRGRVTHVYEHALNGFAASLPDAALSALRGNGLVRSIELDQAVHASGTQTPAPSWGLDRVDQRNLPLDSSYTYPTTAASVTAYVVDTGIQLDHPDFGGRAVSGTDTVDGDTNAGDCNGHGTHVAGTIGGTGMGLAKAVRLVAVRVLDCNGSGATSGVIAGLDWVVANHPAGAPAVANMSLGGGASATLDAAVKRVVADGVTIAVAAGNENADSCTKSPARVPEALTVAASDRNDARASFSNRGTCVDLFAPGVEITSDWLDGGTNTISGTSMASPHVAGAAALYLSGHPSATPAQVGTAILGATTKNKVTGTEKSCVLLIVCSPATPNNHLLYAGA